MIREDGEHRGAKVYVWDSVGSMNFFEPKGSLNTTVQSLPPSLSLSMPPIVLSQKRSNK